MGDIWGASAGTSGSGTGTIDDILTDGFIGVTNPTGPSPKLTAPGYIVQGLNYTGADTVAGVSNYALLEAALAVYESVLIPPSPISGNQVIGVSQPLIIAHDQTLSKLGGGFDCWAAYNAFDGVCVAPGTDTWNPGVGPNCPVYMNGARAKLMGFTVQAYSQNKGVQADAAIGLGLQCQLVNMQAMAGNLYSINDFTGNAGSSRFNNIHAYNSPLGGNGGAFYWNSGDGECIGLYGHGTTFFDTSGGGFKVEGGHMVNQQGNTNMILKCAISLTAMYIDSCTGGTGNPLVLCDSSTTGPFCIRLVNCNFYSKNGTSPTLDMILQEGVTPIQIIGGVAAASGGQQYNALINGSSGADQIQGLSVELSSLVTDTTAAVFPNGIPIAYTWVGF